MNNCQGLRLKGKDDSVMNESSQDSKVIFMQLSSCQQPPTQHHPPVQPQDNHAKALPLSIKLICAEIMAFNE